MNWPIIIFPCAAAAVGFIATLVSTQITPFLSHDREEGRRELVARRLNLILKLSGFGLAIAAVAVLDAPCCSARPC